MATHVPLVAWTPTVADARTADAPPELRAELPGQPAATRAPASTGTKGPDRVWRTEDAARVATSATVWPWPESARLAERGGVGRQGDRHGRCGPDGTDHPLEGAQRGRARGGDTARTASATGGASPSGTTSANRSGALVDAGSS